MDYKALGVVSPSLEPLAPTPPLTLAVLTLCGLVLLWLAEQAWKRTRNSNSDSDSNTRSKAYLSGLVCLWLAATPYLLSLFCYWSVDHAIIDGNYLLGPGISELLWFAMFSGFAVYHWCQCLEAETQFLSRLRLSVAQGFFVVAILAVSSTLWWVWQSQQLFDSFLMGFNDCGHFAQRIANTAAGRGWLLESPVLPAFWDHFNPGLTLLVPLWWLWPDMSLFFWLQAFSLASGSLLLFVLANRLQCTPGQAVLWATAWLLQPVLGQMNLAYGYGWHPISLAIPMLLAMLVFMVDQRWIIAGGFALLACSIEEGCFVIIATTAASLAVVRWVSDFLDSRIARARDTSVGSQNGNSADRCTHSISSTAAGAVSLSRLLFAWQWIMIAAVATVGFVLVFKFSGLAQFQTGRFVALGNSLSEIVLSPILRPGEFWGRLLRSRNAIYLLGLLVPCGAMAFKRGWPLLLPLALPLGVLMVWNHFPAQSLTFHYASTLLPVLWLAAIAGANACTRWQHTAMAVSAVMTGLVASLSMGQLPWSIENLNDMKARTYESSTLRKPGMPDWSFATTQSSDLKRHGQPVLATGRLATHLVGVSELETVGQFFERREALGKLTPEQDPLLRYRYLMLDRIESFQQTPDQTRELEQTARSVGFTVVAEQDNIVVLEHR